MRVEVSLFATLTAYLPPGSRDGMAVVEVPPGSTVDDVSRALGIPPDLALVSLVNGHDVEPGHPLAPQDVVSLFPPLAGGGAGRRPGITTGQASATTPARSRS